MQDVANNPVHVGDVDLAILIDIGPNVEDIGEYHTNDSIHITDVHLAIMVHVAIRELGQLGIGMIVDAGSDLGRGLSRPTTVLIHGIIDLDEVDVSEVDVVALLIHSPVNLETGIIGITLHRNTGGIVGQ